MGTLDNALKSTFFNNQSFLFLPLAMLGVNAANRMPLSENLGELFLYQLCVNQIDVHISIESKDDTVYRLNIMLIKLNNFFSFQLLDRKILYYYWILS